MALITGLPNFFNSAKPVQSDFNNAAKAICTQVGGTYYDEAVPGVVAAGGNLNASNFVATSQFRNSQKAEPYSYFVLSSNAGTKATGFTGTTAYPDTVLMGGCAVPYIVLGLNIVQTDVGAAAFVGGSIDLYLNNALLTTLTASQFTDAANALAQASFKFNYALGGGDMLWVDFSSLNPFGSGGGTAWTIPQAALQFTMLCKALHSR